MGIQIAKKDIKVYKGFDGTNARAVAPFQNTSWGKLTPGRILRARYFSPGAYLCVPGVHAATHVHDAKLAGLLVWEAVIPAGTKYYKASVTEGQDYFDKYVRGCLYRATKLQLVRQVKGRGV